MRIYFDNASTTPLLPEVREVMKNVIDNTYGNPSSIHLHGRSARIIIEESRKQIANALKASTGEIFFTSGATEANNMVFMSSIRDLGVTRIISSPIEHHCILHALDYIEEQKLAEVVYLKVDKEGKVDLEELGSTLAASPSSTLVSLMHANNELGTIQDIDAIGRICQEHKALFHTDTAQTMAKLPIDVSVTPISFLCGASHKFFGPKGVGFVYINSNNMIKPLFHGGDQERGMRSGTENIYGIAGMAKAFTMAIADMDTRHQQVGALKDYFKNRLLNEIHDIQINGSVDGLYNILSVSFPKSPKSEMLMMNLDISGISASSGSACSSGVENDSHVLEVIGHDPNRKTIRFSFSHLNTKEEVDYLMEKLSTLTVAAQNG